MTEDREDKWFIPEDSRGMLLERFGEIGIRLDESGFIEVDRKSRTNIPRIYAAGDVTGSVRQIVTAVGEGSTAVIAAFEDMSHPYWLKKEH